MRGKVNNLGAKRTAYGRMPVASLPVDKCIDDIEKSLNNVPHQMNQGTLYLSTDGTRLHLRVSGSAQHKLFPFKRTMEQLKTELPWLKETTIEFGTDKSLVEANFDENGWTNITPKTSNISAVPETESVIEFANQRLTKIPPKGPQGKTYYTHVQGLRIDPAAKKIQIIANMAQYEVDRKLAKEYLSEMTAALRAKVPSGYQVGSVTLMPHAMDTHDFFDQNWQPLWLNQ